MGNAHVRSASASDAPAVARIGRVALPRQYEGLVDSTAVEAAVEQSYSVPALAECIRRCDEDPVGHFLVAAHGPQIKGFLHFDCQGPEPELHRLYVADEARGEGVGSLLIEALHDRIGPSCSYMLLVVSGNDRAVRFYTRHGISAVEEVDGLSYYRKHMGVEFPAGTRSFTFLLMRRDRTIE